MKKAYSYVEIKLEKFEDVILTSGEYLETDKTLIGINPANSGSFNLMSSVSDMSSYDVPSLTASVPQLYNI